MEARLIDTNVMLAASAIYSDLSNLVIDASPPEAEYREMAYEALQKFAESEHSLVLDEDNTIREEYERNMRYNQSMHDQEYGMKVLQRKMDENEISWVFFDVVEANGERIASLSPELEVIAHDREDRKWVAAAKAHNDLYDIVSPIVYAAESDWYAMEEPLSKHGIAFIRLLPDEWYEAKLTRDD